MPTFTGLLKEAKRGWVLEMESGAVYVAGPAELAFATYADQPVRVTGEFETRADVPAFVLTPAMRAGLEPMPAGVPVEWEAGLPAASERRVLRVVEVVRV